MARALDIPIITAADGTFAAQPACRTCRLVGVDFTIGTLTADLEITLVSLGRTVLDFSPSVSGYYPVGELLRKADGTASTSYGEGGAVIHQSVNVTVSGGGANMSGDLLLIYELD